MCDTKFWKGIYDLLIKSRFRNFERFLSFSTFSVLKKIHSPFLEVKNFFFN
jgi:hypothetical protein